MGLIQQWKGSPRQATSIPFVDTSYTTTFMREFDLLQHVFDTTRTGAADRVIIGPGDDLAMVRLGGRDLLAGVDQLVAGRHVNLAATPLDLVGRKAITRCLSDIAAMAGRPVASLAAVVLPPDFGSGRAKELFNAMRDTAEAFNCPLIGGDIAFHGDASHPLTCSVTVLAEPTADRPITRAGAIDGDSVYVTGRLGGAVNADGSGRHLTFDPRISEAIELAETLANRLHAMIDLSDGLGRDASHIAERSNCAIEIDASAIPCAANIDWKRAASDGEDYELLFTATGDVPTTLGDNVPVTKIGKVITRTDEDQPLVIIRDGDSIIPADQLGWQHEA